MTESSQDKTKRKLINHIKTIKPTHQTAIFFNDFDDAFQFNNLMQEIKKPVSAAFKSITMIWVLRLKISSDMALSDTFKFSPLPNLI